MDIAGSLQLLHAPHVRARDKALLRAVMVKGGLEWISPRSCQGGKSFRAVSAAILMEMGTSFGNVLTPLWFKFVKILSFTI